MTTSTNRPTLEKDHLRRLKAHAHALKPVVWIGQQGLTESVMKELDQALEHHELLKIKILESDRDLRHNIAESAAETLGAALVGHVGHISILYRRRLVRD